MKKQVLIISISLLLLLYFSSCESGSSLDKNAISTDTATITAGKTSFIQNCSGCHNFRQDGIGPQLGGLTTEIPAGWINNFIKNPQQVISSGDERASQM